MSDHPLHEGLPHLAPIPPSRYAYIYYRCRCDDCRAANRAYVLKRTDERARLLREGLVSPRHGSVATYSNYKCRCDKCRIANSRKSAGRRSEASA